MSQHRKWMLSLGLATAMLLGGAVQAQDLKRLETLVDKAVTQDHFSGAVLVAKGDQVLLDKGYGSANLEWNIPNSPNTKFRLGSVTKQFTAASVLLLQERGKLAVADPVSKYLSGLPAAHLGHRQFHVDQGIPGDRAVHQEAGGIGGAGARQAAGV